MALDWISKVRCGNTNHLVSAARDVQHAVDTYEVDIQNVQFHSLRNRMFQKSSLKPARTSPWPMCLVLSTHTWTSTSVQLQFLYSRARSISFFRKQGGPARPAVCTDLSHRKMRRHRLDKWSATNCCCRWTFHHFSQFLFSLSTLPGDTSENKYQTPMQKPLASNRFPSGVFC